MTHGEPIHAEGGKLGLRWHTAPAALGAGTVVATGVFDLLHVGHLHFLRCARAAGTRLVIGVEDDERATARKGSGRPIVTGTERCALLAALEPVDAVFLISGPPSLAPAPAYYALLATLAPSALAFTAGDPAEGGKRLVAARLGARAVEVPQLQGRSTTWLVTRLFDASARPRTDFGDSARPRTDFGDSARPRTDFGDSVRPITEFGDVADTSAASAPIPAGAGASAPKST